MSKEKRFKVVFCYQIIWMFVLKYLQGEIKIIVLTIKLQAVLKIKNKINKNKLQKNHLPKN